MIKLKIDPRNPGEFLASCGLFELCELREPGGLAYFDQVGHGCEFVVQNTSVTLWDCWMVLKNARTSTPPSEFLNKIDEKIRPVRLITDWGFFDLNWWLTPTYEKNEALKMWGGHAKAKDLVEKAIEYFGKIENHDEILEKYYSLPEGDRAQFGLDARTAWTKEGLGYSRFLAKERPHYRPGIELLGAIGLQNFFAQDVQGSELRYWIWHRPLPLIVARVVASRKLRVGEVHRYKAGRAERGRVKCFKWAEID